MSRIEKLSICGIRSFSPFVREAIQFNTPLTLIVGYNGSGKTTVIECLKYATTGELPPNSKGGAFIHDPKLCGEREVLAQVKLQFRSINDRQHVATRSLQLTVKKTTRSQKTLDCSLVVNNGERTTTSTRQAQLDEMIPERLGVSPAILDAVIFCHQDDSLWPLSEPAALKKRFDEIFEAHKYTKVIENLKLLRKKQVEELAKLQNDEAHNKANKGRGERAEKRMTGLQAQIEAAREQCEALSASMHETQEQIKEKHEQANSFLQIVQNLANKKEQLEFRQSTVVELRQTLDELPEDDASLQKSLAHYEQEMEQYNAEAERNKEQYADFQRKLADLRKDLSTKLADQGKFRSDKEKYERQLDARSDMIRHAARTHAFRVFDDGDLTDAHISSFFDKFHKLLADRRRDLEHLQRDNAAELDEAAAAISNLERQKAASTQDRVSAKQRIGTLEKRISLLQDESSMLKVDQGAKTILADQLNDLNEKLQRLQQDAADSSLDRQLSETNTLTLRLELESEQLGQELVECTRHAAERAQLEIRKKELADRKRKLKSLYKTWGSKLAAIVGEDWEPVQLESRFRSVLSRQSERAQAARAKRDEVKEKQQKVGYRLKMTRDAQERSRNELASCKNDIMAALRGVREDASVDDYQEAIEEMEQQMEELRNEASLFDALMQYYTKCKRKLDKEKRCLLCERHFDDEHDASLQRLAKKIDKQLDPAKKAEVMRDLKELTAGLETLRKSRPSHDTYQKLLADQPALWDEAKGLESEHEALERQLEQLDTGVSREEEEEKDLDDLGKTVRTITSTLSDITSSEAHVERIASQQRLLGSSARSVDEIHERQAQLAEQIKSAKNRASKLTGDRQRIKDHISSLELERSELNTQISRTAGQLEKKQHLQAQIQSLKEDTGHQRQTIQRADEQLEQLEPSLREARAARDETLRRGRSKEQATADVRDAIARTLGEIQSADTDIQGYVDRGGHANLAGGERAIAALEASIGGVEADIAALTVCTNKLKQDIDRGDRTRKNISDNLHYRRHLGTLRTLRTEIAALEERDAREDHKRLRAEARGLENRANRLLAERGSVMGAMKTKDEELGRLLQEWELDYKDAKQRYRASHIRVETTKAAIDDLARCAAAVDKAVMRFHAIKMAEVNRIAGELWQSTYQGTDVDTILIRSDHEAGGRAGGGGGGRRSYNYRLCMVKQEAEMDMRGRCSAGQKVLASIVVRLALAESFGVHCGLVALDEPTTNLDRDNIQSLAESLHRIIRARQAQSNLQLIVITHDEEFLRHMRCADFCDSFFRVKRDARQNSVIVRESISKIF